MEENTADGRAAVPRRGRPKVGEEAGRREHVLEAAVAELVERGYEATTMLGVARRAGSSKETLYSWFGSKQGLFVTLIQRQAEETNRRVGAALEGDGEPVEVLTAFAHGLLAMLLGPVSLALNRAAMGSPELADALLTHGRHTTGPLVESYLARLAARGVLKVDDPAEAFQLLYGLTIKDLQIRALLGETPPAPSALADHAQRAVGRFLALVHAGQVWER